MKTLSRHSPLRATIGYVGHEPGVYGDLSARQNLRLFASLYGIAGADRRIDEMLARVGLDGVAQRRRRGPFRAVCCSDWRWRVRCCTRRRSCCLTSQALRSTPRARRGWPASCSASVKPGRLVVLVTHDLAAAAAIATHVVVLRRGRVAHDETRTSFSADEVRAIYQEATRGKA